MHKTIYPLTAILFALLTMAACSHIDEDERLIYEKPAPSTKTVLLEDFTGQRCVNCPKGSEIIEQLTTEFGSSVIAVGIHGGPLGFAGNARNKGLATAEGDEYYNHWQLEYQPVGLIDRHGAVNYADWTSQVRKALQQTAPLTLGIHATSTGQKIYISVLGQGTEGASTGHLQVWLVEDSITAMQLMPDGSTNANYVHNHVFRTSVNGTWGEPYTVKESETIITEMTATIDDDWVKKHLSVIAFVYNDNGVLQAAKSGVIINTEE